MTKNSPESGRGGWTQLSRYRQEPKNAPPMDFQTRDGEIIEAVGKYRFITTEGLLALFAPGGASAKALRRRLALLFHHQYLTRRYLHPMEWPIGVGSSKAIYLLDREGAALLRRKDLMSGDEQEKGSRRKRWGYRQLKHSLSISEFQLALDLALKDYPDAAVDSFVADKEDVGMKARVRISRYTVTKKSVVRKGGIEGVAVWPDASFSIVSAGRRRSYLLEVDEADRKRERMFKRFLAYWQYVVGDTESLRKKRGSSGAFVVFIAPTERRQKALVEIANQVPEVRRRRPGFWFLNEEDVSLVNPGRILREPIALGLDGNPGFLTKF